MVLRMKKENQGECAVFQLFSSQKGMDGVASDLGTLKDSTETSLSEYRDLKADIEAEISGMSDLLAKGEAAQQVSTQNNTSLPHSQLLNKYHGHSFH